MRANMGRAGTRSTVCSLLFLFLAAAGACGGGPLPRQAAPHPTPTTRAGSLPRPTTGCNRPPPAAPGQTAQLTVVVLPAVNEGRTSRIYRLHVAAAYQPGYPIPLLLDFHGAGGAAVGEEQSSGWDGVVEPHQALWQFLSAYALPA